MTTVVIMQPYFFPYIGYYQLIAQSDVFVLYDEVQYIRSGWSNRNRILRQCSPHYLTFPLVSADFRLSYRERAYKEGQDSRDQILRSVTEAYKKAAYFDVVYALVAEIMSFPSATVSIFNRNAIAKTAGYLGVDRRIIASSELEPSPKLAGPARVLDICRQLGGTRYVNAIGGQALYDKHQFAEAGMELTFCRTREIKYDQGCKDQFPNLSIIDVMMHNSPQAIQAMLDEYDLV